MLFVSQSNSKWGIFRIVNAITTSGRIVNTRVRRELFTIGLDLSRRETQKTLRWKDMKERNQITNTISLFTKVFNNLSLTSTLDFFKSMQFYLHRSPTPGPRLAKCWMADPTFLQWMEFLVPKLIQTLT